MPTHRLINWRNAPRILGFITFCLGGSVLVGWNFGNQWLEGAWFGDVKQMYPINALLFVVLGGSLTVWSLKGFRWRWLPILGGSFTAVVAIIRFADAMLHLGLGLDRLVFRDAVLPPIPVSLGLGHTTPIAFFGIGIGMALLASDRPGRWPLGQVMLGPSLLLAFFAISGHLFESLIFDRPDMKFPMSFPTSLTLLVAGCGVLVMRPQIGAFGILLAPNLGGVMARRLFPIMLLAPPLVGILTLWLLRASFVYPAAQAAVLVTMTGPTFAVATLVIARRLETTSVALVERGRELAAAREAAEEASRAKSIFLASMSHELRTPLNAIIGFSEILRGPNIGNVPALFKEYANDIGASGSHLLAIVNQILDFAQVEAGNIQLVDYPIVLAPMVEACFAVVRDRAERDGLRLEYDVPRDFPEIIVDELRLKQVLLNIVSNAVKFNVAGGSVTLGARVEESGDATIWVRDTGIGMNQTEIEAAFLPFGQVNGGLDRRFEGTGVGLPLARSLMEHHGGSLDLESRPGSGTTAFIRLPADRVTAHRRA